MRNANRRFCKAKMTVCLVEDKELPWPCACTKGQGSLSFQGEQREPSFCEAK